MGASAYVGRVGGLAVALGVGAAVATGQGVAWASPTESNSSASESSSSADADSGSSSGATSGSSTDDSPASEPASELASEPSSETSATTSTSEAASTSSSATRTAKPGEVVSTGGAQTSKKVTQKADDTGSDEAAPEPAADAEEVEEAEEVEVVAPEESEAVAPPTQTPIPPTTTDEVPIEKKSSDVPVEKKSSDSPAVKSAQASVDRVPAPTSTAEVRTVEVVADKVVNTEPATETVLQGTTFAEESTTVEAKSFSTTRQDAAPVMMMVAPDAPTARPTFPRLLTNALSIFGIGAMSANTPGVPIGSPAVLALFAWASRRETDQASSALARSTTTTSTPVAALALVDAPSAAAVTTDPGTTRTPEAVSSNTHFIDFVTGPNSLNKTGQRFGIGGTDLGIMWDNGIPDNPATTEVNEHQVLIAFGDTFSNSVPVRTGVWRMNTLFRSPDNTLSNGLYVPDGIPHNPGTYSGSPMSDPNFSREIIGRPRYGIGPEVTIIPTAAISVPGAGVNGATRQYIQFMAVRSWDTPGRWTTNYSGIAYSDDNGQNWRSELVPASSIRTAAVGRATVPYVSGNEKFQQGAFVKPPAGSPEAAAGWVYSYGTPSGRAGTVYLSRVNQYQILDRTKYEYWNGTTWVADRPSAATPILPGTTTSFFGFFPRTTYPSVSEMSVQYNPYLNKYVMLYADQNNNVVMRTANQPQGTWSAPTTLVTSARVPGLYAPYVHPWSGTDNLTEAERQYLYWNLSTWNDYQVRLMRTDLTLV
jgi:hypothetical protein